MDKKLFSAKGVLRDKNEYFEFVKVRKHFAERKIRPLLIVCGVISLMLCVYDVIIMEDILALMSAGFAFLFLYPTLFSGVLEAQKSYDTDKNKVLNVGVYCDFYDNRFSATIKDNKKDISYSKIIGMIETKKRFYLFADDDKVYYSDKELFETGDSTEFKDFIKAKIKENPRKGK